MFRFNKIITNAAVGMISLGALILIAPVTASNAGPTAQAQAPAARKVSFIPPEANTGQPSLEGVARGMPAGSDNVLVFSAPPRESEEDGNRIYRPIAEYLSRITGKTIVYKHPSDWLTYQTEMQRGSYDLVFDGPHFNSWRISRLQHNVLVKIAGDHAFGVVVRKDNSSITNIKQLAGQMVCGMDPPNLGTLTVLNQFDNPMRQPLIINSMGWDKAYDGLVRDKRCAAAILPIESLKKFHDSENLVRVVFTSKTLPNQAFSAGPRISRNDQALIAAALISPEANRSLSPLLAIYGDGQGLAYTSKAEYAGFDVYLKNTWGY
ncbi:MAG: phosphate/phosphite/phosphonate ABC transporter substrate-binding protein [Sulfuricaulis sp.]